MPTKTPPTPPAPNMQYSASGIFPAPCHLRRVSSTGDRSMKVSGSLRGGGSGADSDMVPPWTMLSIILLSGSGQVNIHAPIDPRAYDPLTGHTCQHASSI